MYYNIWNYWNKNIDYFQQHTAGLVEPVFTPTVTRSVWQVRRCICCKKQTWCFQGVKKGYIGKNGLRTFLQRNIASHGVSVSYFCVFSMFWSRTIMSKKCLWKFYRNKLHPRQGDSVWQRVLVEQRICTLFRDIWEKWIKWSTKNTKDQISYLKVYDKPCCYNSFKIAELSLFLIVYCWKILKG